MSKETSIERIKTKPSKYGTVIKPCTCNNSYQDMKYGYGKRVHNLFKKGDSFRCSVCGKEKNN